MKLLDERNQVRGAAARWRACFFQRGAWFRTIRGCSGDVYAKLQALDVETATAADVEAIVGNDTCCSPQRCDECGICSWHVVQLGEEPDYESATACVCLYCLRKAADLCTKGVG